MIPILSLWLPIVVSAVLVFIASSILHMVFTYHHKEYRKLPNEDDALEALRRGGVTPGLYHFPHCSTPADMKNPDMADKYAKGPVGFMSVVPNGLPNMGAYLAKWFGFLVVVGVFIAYLAGRTFAPGADYLAVFRFVGTVAFLTYGVGQIADTIWKGAPASATVKNAFDGLIYALVTAGAFGWLWP